MLKEIVTPILEQSKFEPVIVVKDNIRKALVSKGFSNEDVKIRLTTDGGKITVRRDGRIHLLDFKMNANS